MRCPEGTNICQEREKRRREETLLSVEKKKRYHFCPKIITIVYLHQFKPNSGGERKKKREITSETLKEGRKTSFIVEKKKAYPFLLLVTKVVSKEEGKPSFYQAQGIQEDRRLSVTRTAQKKRIPLHLLHPSQKGDFRFTPELEKERKRGGQK